MLQLAKSETDERMRSTGCKCVVSPQTTITPRGLLSGAIAHSRIVYFTSVLYELGEPCKAQMLHYGSYRESSSYRA